VEELETRVVPSASVGTDLFNYMPGIPATISASGFQAGETVQFQVLHTDGTANTGANEAPWQVTDTSGAGNVQTSWFCDPADLGSFEVIAIGETSGAVATSVFSDLMPTYSGPVVPPAVTVATDQSDYTAPARFRSAPADSSRAKPCSSRSCTPTGWIIPVPMKRPGR
jgi:hypothetical protein